MTHLFDLGRTLVAFAFALGIIILVHEAGHFFAARAFGMRVLAFAIGFGKRIWGFERGGTEFKLCAFPLGGYVKLASEEPGDTSDDPRDFLNRPRWQRVVVYLAGPLANAVLSIVVIAGLFVVGVDVPALQSIPAEVGTVEAGSPGEAAGIAAGDRIVAIDGKSVDRWQDVAFAVMTSIDRPLAFEIERDGRSVEATVTPHKPADFDFGDAGIYPKVLPHVGQVVAGSPAEQAGLHAGDELLAVDGRPLASPSAFVDYVEAHPDESVVVTVGRRGERLDLAVVPAPDAAGKGKIGVQLTISQRFPLGRALVESVRFNYDVAKQSLAVIGKIFTREVAAKSALAGPIEIAAQSGAAARTGFKSLLYLMGVISLSVGLLNLFPIPILDGGQIVILLVESVLRRDLSVAVKERIAQVGLAMIVLLMVTVLWFDVSKRFLGS
ncbi:MAG: RIP metalloprotease RseP [Holophagales bacterium]|nr:RIP metalloprotease RseP [Holophagales bacterium]